MWEGEEGVGREEGGARFNVADVVAPQPRLHEGAELASCIVGQSI